MKPGEVAAIVGFSVVFGLGSGCLIGYDAGIKWRAHEYRITEDGDCIWYSSDDPTQVTARFKSRKNGACYFADAMYK